MWYAFLGGEGGSGNDGGMVCVEEDEEERERIVNFEHFYNL